MNMGRRLNMKRSVYSHYVPLLPPRKRQIWRYHFCILLLVAVFLALPVHSVAQSRVTINRAKEVVGITVNGERVRKLIGNVNLKTQDLTLYCDSAYQYLEKSEVRAFGNIEIETPAERIYADTLVYFTDLDFSQLRGRVIIDADSSTLYSQAVDYRFSTKVGHFLEKVRLEDPDGILVANTGFYYREPDSAVFRGNVQISDTLQYAEGDSLFINRRTGKYRLYGDLYVNDRENRVILKGDSLRADSTGHRYLEGNSWLKKFGTNNPDSSSSDTTHIRSRIIHSVREITAGEKDQDQDTSTVINAYHNVRIWSPRFSSTSDSARYESRNETFELTSSPKAWHKQIQLTGPYIKVMLRNEEIDKLVSHPSPFVVERDSALERLNQVKGDTLVADFTAGEISRIRVRPNGHLLKYTENDNGEPDGAIDMTATSITLLFKEGALDSMVAKGPIDGTYLPESKETTERRLDGFVWTPEERPEKPAEPMQRRLPPIPDQPPFEPPARFLQAQNRE